MSNEPDNLILVYLRRLDENIDRLGLAVVDIGCRITSLDAKAALIHGDCAAQSQRLEQIPFGSLVRTGEDARQNNVLEFFGEPKRTEKALDRIDQRLERIEHRLDIVDA